MSLAAPAEPRRDWEYVEAWGMSSGHAARVIRPRSTEELQAALGEARAAGVRVAPRGAGCSYGAPKTQRDRRVMDHS
ncbi:MAG: FAD-dependent oxidoreductase, partial [Planctomycetes bacterium]|nr:FAD-dependent oxidoreductase [Planctomycetota bacterium]